MSTDPVTVEQLALLIHDALGSADLDAYRELLDPHVRWGPPDDDVSGCHNRDEVLEWYRLARDSGMRADVVETVVKGDRILVGLRVHPAPPSVEGDVLRWQVLRVANGMVRDIRGFDERDEAIRRMW